MTGAVSFSPAGENDWVQASINRPLTTGDRLWTDAGARAELQVGGAMLRMSAGTSVVVLNLDDSIAQLQVTQGTLNMRVRRLDPNQVIEIDTPNLAFTVRQPGEYRVVVDADDNATDVIVRKGQGEVYGEGASYVIDSRQPYRFMGTGLREYEPLAAAGFDDFDRWSSDRDRRYDNSPSARYVSPDVIGYQDLDANGTWRTDATYGNVWFPTRVAAGWAPYRDGHWAWVDPWGWTWVDDAPWGFAVSHYGRWANLRGTWGWVPGPVRTRAYYAPALVAFVGGNNFQLTISSGNVGGVAWFPLGPREVYRPSYPVSRRYFENVNVSNTIINTTVINNYYNNRNVTNVTYANRQVPGAIVAVPTTTFVQSQPVNRSAVRVTREMVASAPVAAVAAVAPTERSVRGAAAQADKPPAKAVERAVVARTAPPAAPVGFAAQQQQLAAKPGTPLEDAERKELRRPPAAPGPAVNVVVQPRAAPPTALPPPAPMAGTGREGRGKGGEQKGPPTAAVSGAPVAPGRPDMPKEGAAPEEAAAPPRAAPPARVAQPAAAPPAPVVQPAAAPPAQVAQPAAAPPSQDQRGKPEQRGRTEQRGRQPEAPPPAAAQAPAPAAPPQIAPAGPPPQRSAQPMMPAPPQGTPPAQQTAQPQQPAPRQPAPPQQAAQPKLSGPPQGAPPAPPAPQVAQPAKPEPAPVARQAERGPPVAAPRPPPVARAERAQPEPAAQIPRPQVRPDAPPAARAPQQPPPVAAAAPPPAQPQLAPRAEPQGRGPRPDAGKGEDNERRRREEARGRSPQAERVVPYPRSLRKPRGWCMRTGPSIIGDAGVRRGSHRTAPGHCAPA